MGSRVAAVAEIGFDLDQPNHQPKPGIQPVYETTTHEFEGDPPAIPSVEREAMGRTERHLASIGESTPAAPDSSRNTPPR